MEPPLFPTGGPQIVRAAPGSAADLLLPVPFGSPPFQYDWSRAGATLDERFIVSDDAGGVRLTVSAARTGDSGVYTLQASNAAGKDTTRVRLEVSPDETPVGEDPPNFLRRLQDLTVKVGTRTRFLVEIVSSTECKVTWYRNERRLMETERVALVRDGNFWCADVATVSVDDAGRWTCTAENVGGRASCSAHLNVLVPKAYKRPEFVEELRALLTEQGTVSLECKVVGVPTPVLRWFKDSREIKAGDVFALTANAEDPTSLGTYTCEAVNCMGRAYSSSKVHVVGRASREGSARPSSGGLTPDPPPIFTKELEDQFVRICDPLTLNCHIVVPPWPRSVVWYNKEGKIEPSERYHVLEDGVGGYLLEVSSAEWADEGEWKCVASTAGGRVGMSSCYVSMDVPKNYRKPRFMENLQAVLTEEGLVSFECKVVGFPTPVLSWFKDGQELKPGDVYQLTGTNSLGSYCCIARNCMGQASSSAELTVEDIQNQLNEEEKHQLFSKNQAPKFLQGLKSVEAKIDEPFRFTIKVAIPPEPTLLWYRDDQPVDESSRCHHGKEERGVFYLDIQNLEFLDQAEWKCVAMNDFGQSVTSCFLKLIIPRHYKKPRFLENLQAILSDEGAVNLECKVIGVPQPVLKWYKDGEELKPGDIHRIISGQDGTCCLGTYTCEAQNCMGIAASSASLLGFDDSLKAKSKKKSEEQTLQRNLSLSTIHEERTSQMYDTPLGDRTLDDKGEISFSFDGKEVSVSLYETPDLTEEEALQIVEMYADQLSENVTEHNVVELPPLRFVKETSTSGNLLMEAIIIDVSPEYFTSPEEDLRTEADIEDISIADENGPPQISLDQDFEISGPDYLEKTMALLSDEKADMPKKLGRKKSDSQRSVDDYFSLSRDQSLSDDKKDDDTQVLSESDLQSFASARSSERRKTSKPSLEEPIPQVPQTTEITKTISSKDDVVKPKDIEPEVSASKTKRERRRSRSSRRSSSGSEKSVVKIKDELGNAEIEQPSKKLIADDEYKTKINNIGIYLSKLINDIQIIERDIILQSELMSSSATASKSLEIIGSLITPLTEMHSIIEAAKESATVNPEINSTLFTYMPQSFKALYQSLTIIEKCIDVESDNKTLVKKTCVSLVEKCGNDIQKAVSEINSLISKKYLDIEEKLISDIEATSNEMITIIRFSTDTIKTRSLLHEASEFKPDEPSLEMQHSKDTQKAIFELKSPLQSLLRIVESTETDHLIDGSNVKNSEIILEDMSISIQHLQEALEQIESLSVKESTTPLITYNTEIIETVMDSVLKLRTSFEQLSTEAKKEENENVLKEVLATIKLNLNELSSHIDTFEQKVGKFDILQSENKLEVLQKMAQTLISFENNLPVLEVVQDVKNHMVKLHKNLTKVLENVIESNDASKYFAFMEICDSINRVNSSVKNIELHDIFTLTSINNTLKIVQNQFIQNLFEPELNCAILSNIEDIQINLLDNISIADEISLKTESERIQDLALTKKEELKARTVLESINHSIAAITKVVTEEHVNDLKSALTPVFESIQPNLVDLKQKVASMIAVDIEREDRVSEISDVSLTNTLAEPLFELNQNIAVLNQTLIENVKSLTENSTIAMTYAQSLQELQTTIETLQHEVISQCGEDILPYELSSKMANVVQNLQNCIVLIQEQSGVETADEMSTLEDVSGIKTTTEIMPVDHLVLPTTEEVLPEQLAETLKPHQPELATAETLQALHEHVELMQAPDIIEFLESLSENSDYTSLKSVAVSLGELNEAVQEIFHPMQMENSNELLDSLNTSKLIEMAEPIQDLRQSLSVVATSDIPIYESFLKIPSEKIHSAIEKITEFKDHLERCLNVIIPAIETIEEMIEISSNIDLIKKMCIDLNIIFQDSEGILTCISPEVSSFKQKLNNFLEATNMPVNNVREVKSLTENLYAELLLVQDELIKSTPQPSETIAQEIKLIESVQELENKIAVLEQFHFVDLSRASDIESCISPQLAVEIESESLNNIDDLVNHAANVVQDAGGKTPTADLMILEDFFKTCKLEFSILRCLIKKRPTHKKIIRLLQEFSFLRSIINDFNEKRSQLFVPKDIKDLLSDFMLNLDISMKDIEKSLIKIVNLQSKVLIESPMRILENNTKTIRDVTKNNKIPTDLEQQFIKLVEYICPHFGTLQTAIVNELQCSEISSILAVEKNTVIEQVDNFFAVLEEQMLKTDNEDQKQVIEKVLSCSQKHQDYKDVTGQSKMLLILKCLAECSTILNEQLINDADETTINEDIISPDGVTLQSILLEMVQPLQGLRDQLVSIQEQISSGVDEEYVSVDVTSTESYVQVLTDIHKNVLQIIESEKPVLEEADLSLIETLDSEFQTIQESIQSVSGPADVVKQITSPLEEIEKSLHLVKEKGIVESQITVSKDKAEALLQHIDQYIEFVEIIEEESAILKICDFLETAKIAKELRESIDSVTKVTVETDTEIKLSSHQDLLMNKLHRALSSIQEQALDSVLEMAPSFDDYKRRHVMEVVATLQADLLAITSIQVAIVAPSDSTTEQLQLTESRISDAVEKQEKAPEKREKIEKSVVADEVSTEELSEVLTEAPQKTETLDLDVKTLTESEDEISPYLEKAENLGKNDVTKYDASTLNAEKLEQANITETSVIERDEKDIAIEFGQIEDINAVTTEEVSPTTLSIGALVQHIKEYLSEDVIKTIANLGTISDYTKLEESLNVANELHDNIIALEVLPMESVSLLQNEEYAAQKEIVLHLQEELDVLHELTLSKAEELKAVIGEKSLDRFAEVVQNLQADIVFITSSPLIVQISKQIDLKDDEVSQMDDSNQNIPIPQDEQMLAVEVPEKVTKDEVKTQTLDIRTAPEKSSIKEHKEEITDQCPDMEDIDSINKLETLLSEVTNQVNLSSADVDDTELLRNVLDEVQTVIIKLKCDFDETVNDTLNETLEDLECSVRSVQLQIDENSPPELLKDACATLQLLVNNMSDIKDQVTNPPKEKNSKEMLQKCFVSTEQTIKLLDDASKADSDGQLMNVISKLKLLKDTLKILSSNFRGDACSLINNGVEVIQTLDQMEEQIFALEKDIEAATTKTDVKDSIVVAVHTVYENISNMRSTLSSIQKEYMYENYAKPSESFLRSLKNISFLFEHDKKCNWKHLRKVLRQVLNHFEDIKFYVNFDKTARIPSDAAITKIILDELSKELNEVLLSNVIESYPEMSDKVYKVLEKVKESNDSIQTRTTIEVKEKIPLFKMISEELVQLTNAIRKYVEDQIKTDTEEREISEDIELGEEERINIIENLEQSGIEKPDLEDSESTKNLKEEDIEESDTLKTNSKGLEIPQPKKDIKVTEVGKLDVFVQEQTELAKESDETVEAGEAEKDVRKMEPPLETEKEIKVLDEGKVEVESQSEDQQETLQIQTKLEDSDQQANEYKETHDDEEMVHLDEIQENVLKASEAETDMQFSEFTAGKDEGRETENKTKEVETQEQRKVVSRDEEKQLCKDNVTTEETKDEKLKEEEKTRSEEQGVEEKLQEEVVQSTQKLDKHTDAKAAENDLIKKENERLYETATSQQEQDIVQEKEILQSDEKKKDTLNQENNMIDETLLQGKKETERTEISKQQHAEAEIESEKKLSEKANAITAKNEVEQEKLGLDTIVLNESGTPDVKQMLEEDVLKKESRDVEMKELDKNVISHKEIEQHKSTSLEMQENLKDGENKLDDKKHIDEKTTLQKEKDIVDAESQDKKEKLELEQETEETKIKDEEQIARLKKQRQGIEKELLVEDAKSQKDKEKEIFEKEKQDCKSKKEEEKTNLVEERVEDVVEKKFIEEESNVRKEKETEEGGLQAKDKERKLETEKEEDKKEHLDEDRKSQKLNEATDTKEKKDDEKDQGADKELYDMEGILQIEKEVADAKQKEEVENDQLEKETKTGIPEHLDEEAKLGIDKEGGAVKQTEKEIEDNVSKCIDEATILQKREEIFNAKQKPEEKDLGKEIIDANMKYSLENEGRQKIKEAVEAKQSRTENLKKDKIDGENQKEMKQREDEDTLCIDKEKCEMDRKRNDEEARFREEEKGDSAEQKSKEEKLGLLKESQETKNKCLDEEAVLRNEKEGADFKKKAAEEKLEKEKQQADEESLDDVARPQKEKEEFESKQTAEEEKPRLEQEMKEVEKRLLDEEAKLQKEKDETAAKQKIEEEKLNLQKENQGAEKGSVDEEAKLQKEREETGAEQKSEEETQRLENETQEAEKKRFDEETRVQKDIEEIETQQKTDEQKQRSEIEKHEDKTKLQKEKEVSEAKQKAEDEKLRVEKQGRLQKDKAEADTIKKAEEEKLEKEKQVAEKKHLDEEARLQKEKEDSEAKLKSDVKLLIEQENQEAEKNRFENKARLQIEKEDDAKQKEDEEKQRLEEGKQEAQEKRVDEDTSLQKEKEETEAKEESEVEICVEKEKLEAEIKCIDEEAKLQKKKEVKAKKKAEKEKKRLEKETQETDIKRIDEEAKSLKEKEEAGTKKMAEEEKLEKEKQIERKHHDEEAKFQKDKEEVEAQKKLEEEILRVEKEKQVAEKKYLDDEARLQKEKEDSESKLKADVKLLLEQENQEAEKKRFENKARMQIEKEDDAKQKEDEEKQHLEEGKQEAQEKRVDEETSLQKEKEETEAKQESEVEKRVEKEKLEAEIKRIDEEAQLQEKKEVKAKKKAEKEKKRLEKETQETDIKRIDEEAKSLKEKEEAGAKKMAEEEKLEKEKQVERKHHDEEAIFQKDEEEAEAQNKAEEEILRIEKKRRDEEARLEKEKEHADAKKKAEEEKLEKENQEADKKRDDENTKLQKGKEEAEAKKEAEEEKLRVEKEKQEAEKGRRDEESRLEKEKEDANAKKKSEEEKEEKEKQEVGRKRIDEEAKSRKEKDAEAKKKAEEEKLENEKQEAEKKQHEEEAKLQKVIEAEANKKTEEEILRVEKEKQEAEKKSHDEEARLQKEKEDANAKKKAEEEKLEKEKQEAEKKRHDEEAKLQKKIEEAESNKKAEEENQRVEKEKQEAEKKLHDEEATLQKDREDADAKKKSEEEILEKEKQDVEKKLYEEEAKLQKKIEAESNKKAEEENLRVEKEKQEAEKKRHDEEATLQKDKEDADTKKKAEEENPEKDKQDLDKKRYEEAAKSQKEKEEAKAKKEVEQEELEKEKQEAEKKRHDKESKLQKEKEAVAKKIEEEKLENEKHIEVEARLQKEKESEVKQKVEQEKLLVENEKQETEKKRHDEKVRLQKEKESDSKKKAEEENLAEEQQQKEKKRLDEEVRLQKEKDDFEARQKTKEEKQRLEKEKQDSEKKRIGEEVKLQKETEEADAKKKAEEEKQLFQNEKQEAENKRVDEDAKLQKEKETAETKKKAEEEKLEKEKQETKRKRIDEEARVQKEKEADAKQKEDEEKQRLEKEKQEAKEKRVDEETRLQKEKEETENKQKAEVEKQRLEKEKLEAEKKRNNEEAKSQKEKEETEAKRILEKDKKRKEKKRLDEEVRLQKEKQDSEAKQKAADEEKQRLEKEKQDAEKKRIDEEVKLQKEKEADAKKKSEEDKQRLEKEKQEAEKQRIDEEANLQKEKQISEAKQKDELEKQRLEKEKQEAKKKDHHEELRLTTEKEEADSKKKSRVENQSQEEEERDAETKFIYQEVNLLNKDEVADVKQKKQVEKLEEESKDHEKNVCVKISDEDAGLQKEKESDALNKEKEGKKRRSSKKKQDKDKKRSEEQISVQKDIESAADLQLKEEEIARRTCVESKTEDKDHMVQKYSEQKEKPDKEFYDEKEIRKKRLDKEIVELNQNDKVDAMYARLSKEENLTKSGLKLIEDYSESESVNNKKAQKEDDKNLKKYEDGMKKSKKDSLYIEDEEGYRTEGDSNKSTKINGSVEKYKVGEIDISSISDLKHDRKEKSHFVNYNNNNIDLEMYKPPGYIEKKYDENNKYLSLDLDSSSKIPTTYKAQSLVYQAQLRSTTPHQLEMGRSSESVEKRIDMRQRSKALSEAKSAPDKRVGTSRDHKRKPVFSTYLTDRTAVEASRVKLTCSVLSSIDPMITWYKNGVLLDNKLKYRTKFVDGLITLEVLNAVPSDSAEYTCTVQNENGSVSTSANLKVYPSFEASPIPPTFTRSIRDTYHLAENELVLECRIRGQPLPTITWFKDGRLISSDERYQAYYLADGVCRLAISAPTIADSGKYTCKAENSMWSDQITHVVNFTGRESRLGPNLATIEKSRFNRQAMESRRPHFTNVLADYKVTRGGTIGLQVEIKGSPTRVEWLREGRSVTEIYRNAQTFVEHGLYTLALADVTEKESGLYTCRAWSSHGNVDMNAAITVVQPNELEGKPAIIVGRPQKDVLISVGEDLNISFRVQGEPKPKVIFMKGIRDITNSQRVCKMTSDDYVKFTLKRSVVSDAGTYCILARNAYGCDRAFVTVVIRQRASSENLISDWTYPQDDTAVSVTERRYKSVPDRIPGEPSVVDGGNNWVSLAWQKSDQQTSAPVLAYRVESWLLGKEGGARWIELGITPLNSFDVFNLKQGEEYHFRVTPRNRYGWGEAVQTSNPVVIGLSGERPEFTEILPGQLKVLVGETAKLSCSFKGKPIPEIVWMKNGHEIEDVDDRIKILLNGFDCCLTIKDVQIEDEARYSCEASNVHGRSSTYARMAVITDRLVWEADAKLKRERSAGVEGEYPPQFTMRLRDRRVQATYPVRLTCQVIGSPAPVVTWFKDGHELAYDSRHNKSQDEHFHTLEIAPTSLEDGGVYEAMARNSSGAVSCRCSLVVDKGIRAYVAPEFCCGLEPLYRLYEGEELRISAMVEAYPSVGVTWYRDGVRLRPSRRAVMTLDHDGQIELALASITRRDAGVYTCTASNEVGRASTSGKVEVVGGDHAADKPATPPVVFSPDVPYSKEPMFIRKPRSSEAYEGDTVIIECEVIGDPKPDVYWLRDFLKPDYYRDANHFKRVGAGPEYRFEIPHAKLDYTGTYSVVARNEHGEAKAIISLQILAKDITASDDAHNVRYGRVDVIPRFDKELTDLLCYDGDAIEFECRVSGNPEPYIKWLHYNEVIRDCPDFETSFEEGTARLKIKQVTAEDEGTYTCEASNHLGKAKSSACLVVYPPGEPNTLSQRLRRPPALLSAASTPRSTPRATPARSVSRTPGPDARRLCSPSREIAPKFYTYPFNKVVEEGERVVFKCAVQGLPNPWATWDKDGIVITPTSRITIREKDEMLRILEIEEVTIEDVGLYRITLENDYGRAEASARLEVISHKGKFYGGVRSCSASPRRTLYRRRTPSTSRQD